jgi:hemerythrin-like domain-containing protein
MRMLNDSMISAACMEHQIFDHIKQALLVTLNWQAPAIGIPRKLSSLQFTIQSLQRHLDRIISIEEEGGYMADAMESKPHLQDRVEQLQGEHSRFRDRLRKLIPELNETKEWDESRFKRICDDLRSFVEDLDRHNEREIEVLQESMCTDEGGEG